MPSMMLLFVVVIFSQCFITKVESKASVVGCVSSKQAESIYEEISRLFDSAALCDGIQSLVSCKASETPLDVIEQCDAGFKDKYKEKVRIVQLRAATAESDIKQANENRVKQVEVARVFEETWKKMKKIWRSHDKTLYALDIFFKDSIMQKAANVGYLIRSGDKKKDWTNAEITKVLADKADTVLQVMVTLPSSIKSVMTSVLTEILWINVASQAYSAVKGSPKQNVLELDYRLAKRFQKFSELSISEDIRRTSKIRFDTMVVGFEEAQEYTSKTNATLERLEGVAANLRKANHLISCAENKRIGVKVLNDLEKIATDLQNNEVKFAAEYLEKINSYYRYTFKPIESTIELDKAMDAIKDTLPKARNYVLEETHKFLNDYEYTASMNGLGSLFRGWFLFLNETVKRMDIMVQYSDCHAKIFRVIGDIIQRCKDGEGSFDELYQDATSSVGIDPKKCRDVSMLEIPTKDELKQTVEKGAKELGYNANCEKNRQGGDQPPIFDFYADDNDLQDRLSPTQRLMVCDLRTLENPKSNVEIAGMIKMSKRSVSAVRCMQEGQSNDMLGQIQENKFVERFLKYS